jgi:predicted DNA-binding transcriptional regulator AlpA
MSHLALEMRAPARNFESIDPDQMIQARAVARHYSISVRTLDRWLHKSHLKFPPPVMVTKDVTGRVANRYWRIGDLIAWERTQAVNHAEAA